MAEIGNIKEDAKSDAAEEIPSGQKEQAATSEDASQKMEENNQAQKPAGETDAKPSAGIAADESSIIYFDHNSNEIPQGAYATLNNIVKFTSRRPDLKISVIGFTDSYGDAGYNKQLSKYRADIVKNYLIGQGVSPANIDAIGKGEQNPQGSNKTMDGRQKNRRVEITVHYR